MYEIRTMRTDDLAAVAAIERETLSPWSWSSLERELTVPKVILIVAEKFDEEIVGWCGSRVIWPEAELMKIAVKADCRKFGIAWALLDYLAGELHNRKVASLFLEVRSENLAAVNLYKNNGFLLVGSRPAYYVDPGDDALILKKNFS